MTFIFIIAGGTTTGIIATLFGIPFSYLVFLNNKFLCQVSFFFSFKFAKSGKSCYNFPSHVRIVATYRFLCDRGYD